MKNTSQLANKKDGKELVSAPTTLQDIIKLALKALNG